MAQRLSVRMTVGGAAVMLALAGAALAADVEYFYKDRDSKFTWLDSVTDDNTICVTWGASPVKTWDDFLTKPSTFGGEGAGSDPDIWALLYKNVYGAATMKDDEFLAEARQLDFDVRPVNAAKVDALLADVYQTPKDAIARATKAIASEGQ
jgi:hypothetical protein